MKIKTNLQIALLRYFQLNGARNSEKYLNKIWILGELLIEIQRHWPQK